MALPHSETKAFTATGQSDPIAILGRANITVSGTFVASGELQRSFDGGTNWHDCTNGRSAVVFNAPSTEVFEEVEQGVQYRFNCSSYTSGTMTVRISQ